MSFPDFESRERKIHSQNGEDGVIEAIFESIGVTNRYFVEFGVEDATECNTSALLERGWQGLMMDYYNVSRNPLATIRNEFVTAENINYLLRKYGVPEQYDLLSIDVDGNDFWIWAVMAGRPRVVVIEYNANFSADERLAIMYEPVFAWRGTDYFGASLAALDELGRRLGYTLVYCELNGSNAFFVANEALPPDYQPRSRGDIFRPPDYYGLGFGWPPDPARKMLDPFFGWNAGLFCVHAQPIPWPLWSRLEVVKVEA